MMIEVEWLEPLMMGPFLMVVVLCWFVLMIRKSHETETVRGN
jgi:hypothetical protein